MASSNADIVVAIIQGVVTLAGAFISGMFGYLAAKKPDKTEPPQSKPSRRRRRTAFGIGSLLSLGVAVAIGVPLTLKTLSPLLSAPVAGGLRPLPETPALSDSATTRLRSMVKAMGDLLARDLRTLPVGIGASGVKTQADSMRFHPWTLAQEIVAVRATIELDRTKSSHWLLDRFDQQCSCWRRLLGSPDPPHVPSTAWCMIALARLGADIPPQAIDALLDAQDDGGWWSVVPADKPKFASTYATCLALLALKEQLDHHLIRDEPREKRIEVALLRGTGWLQQVQEPGQARWKNYPLLPEDGSGNLANSALAIHTLHRVLEKVPAEIDQLWLETLPVPARVTMWQSFEAASVNVFGANGIFSDNSRYYINQWCLIATVDALPGATPAGRANGNRFIETIVMRASPLADIAQNWIMAETVIALRFIVEEGVI